MNDRRDEDYLFNMINPTIQESLNFEQKREIKAVLRRLSPSSMGKKYFDIRFTFWFIKRLYFVWIIGVDQRKKSRAGTATASQRAVTLVFQLLMYLGILISIILVAFLILYSLKSFAGIDILPDMHLQEYLRELLQ